MKQQPFAEFAQARDGQRLIDVREADEYADVHVAGAELHALSRIREGDLPEFDERPVTVICRSGGRSAMAIQIFEAAHPGREFTNISDGTMGAIAHGDESLLERG